MQETDEMLIDLINSDKKALIDESDYELVKNYSWLLSTLGYAVTARTGCGKQLYMHRVIAEAKKDEKVDHINHDLLNNTKSNLRKCTHSQNMANRKMSKSNKLGVRGVWLSKSSMKNPYSAEVKKDGKRFTSRHPTIEKASAWVRQKSIELHGEFACLDGCL